MAKKEEKDEAVVEEKSDRQLRWEAFCAKARKQAMLNEDTREKSQGVSYLDKLEEKLAKGIPESFV